MNKNLDLDTGTIDKGLLGLIHNCLTSYKRHTYELHLSLKHKQQACLFTIYL